MDVFSSTNNALEAKLVKFHLPSHPVHFTLDHNFNCFPGWKLQESFTTVGVAVPGHLGVVRAAVLPIVCSTGAVCSQRISNGLKTSPSVCRKNTKMPTPT